MMKPSVQLSVVFPTYNRKDEMLFTLDKLERNIPYDFEVIILDNSPVQQNTPFGHNVKYFFLGRNAGTEARNIGISEATAPYILMLDDDSHPLEGSIEKALSLLESATPEIAGITGPVVRLDGQRENPPLLPTVFHGCGALFRSSVLKNLNPFYPAGFRFYGEEYWSTLLLYSRGYSLMFSETFKICHRMSDTGRDKAEILYRLTVNNRCTWLSFVPEKYLKKIEFDTEKRYELISASEGVLPAFRKAVSEKTEIPPGGGKMAGKLFEEYSLLSAFKKRAREKKIPEGGSVVLCGAGKFPTLWAGYLEKNTGVNVHIADFNKGLQGRQYGKYMIISPEEACSLMGNPVYILGHSARVDTLRWDEFLKCRGIKKTVRIID
jgi:GT2 family glycosyltransferase